MVFVMDLNELFNFTKTRESLRALEKLLMCKKCNKYCSNPRRHIDCGNLLCDCNSSEYGKCSFCHQEFSPSNTSPDWHVKSIIEATKKITDLIRLKSTNEDTSDNQIVVVRGKIDDQQVKTSNDNLSEKNTDVNKASKVSMPSEDRKSKQNVRKSNERNSESSGGISNPNKKDDQLVRGKIDDKQVKTSNDNLSEKNTDVNKASKVSMPSEDRKSKQNVRKSNERNSESSGGISNPNKKDDQFAFDINNLKVVTNTAEMKSLMKRNAKGETKLHTACVKGDSTKVKEFLLAGADPCTKDYAGWTPLHEAVSKGNLDIVKLLLEAGAIVNAPGGYNNTPLHDAAMGNHAEVARLLMTFGADPELKNIEGFTPKSMAQTEEMSSILNNKYDVIPEKPRKNFYQQDIVLFGCNLSAKDKGCLNNMVKHFKIKQVPSYNAGVTHIVVGTTRDRCIPTIDILSGLLEGKWIIDSQWLQFSLEVNKITDPSKFEVTGTKTFPNSYAPRRSRENVEKMQPSLFNGFHVYFSGFDKIIHNDNKFTKAQLSTLVSVGNGVVLTREPNPEAIPDPERTVPYHAGDGVFKKCSHLIIYQSGRNEPALKYNMNHVKSLPASWLLNCIETFKLMEP